MCCLAALISLHRCQNLQYFFCINIYIYFFFLKHIFIIIMYCVYIYIYIYFSIGSARLEPQSWWYKKKHKVLYTHFNNGEPTKNISEWANKAMPCRGNETIALPFAQSCSCHLQASCCTCPVCPVLLSSRAHWPVCFNQHYICQRAYLRR